MIYLIATLPFALCAVLMRSTMPEVPPMAQLPDRQVENLRAIIQRHTGWQIGELQLQHGHWHALTAYGWKPVTDVLKDSRHPGAARFGEVIV